MRQIALLPSGCQINSKCILHATKNHLYYASTLSLYVINSNSFAIEKIIALGQKCISSICINPHDEKRMCSVSSDGYLVHWDIEKEKIITRST